MRALAECFDAWLKANPSDVGAHKVLAALAGETCKRADSDDPGQREFDALDLAQACRPGDYTERDFDAAKRWVDRQDTATWAEARRTAIEDFFRAAGFDQALQLAKRSEGGRHRAQWYLRSYDLGPAEVEAIDHAPVTCGQPDGNEVIYTFTPPGGVKLSWLGRPWFRAGRFETRSPIGLLWLSSVLLAAGVIVLAVLVLWGLTFERRPLLVDDLAQLLLLASGGYGFWHFYIRPSYLLVEDRVRLAPEALLAWSEPQAQLEFSKDAGRRVVQIVRYASKCPICAGDLELAPGEDAQCRRLFGRCSESPREHVYSFDRVTRRGQRVQH